MPIVKAANVTLMNGRFATSFEFSAGLNILSGEDGTGKTQLIKSIKGGNFTYREREEERGS